MEIGSTLEVTLNGHEVLLCFPKNGMQQCCFYFEMVITPLG
jgi:hypothetical protein